MAKDKKTPNNYPKFGGNRSFEEFEKLRRQEADRRKYGNLNYAYHPNEQAGPGVGDLVNQHKQAAQGAGRQDTGGGSPLDLKKAEEEGSPQKPDDEAGQNEKNRLDTKSPDDDKKQGGASKESGIPYNNETPQKGRPGSGSRRKLLAGGGIISLIVGGGIGLSIHFAPLFLINNLREFISNRVSQVQVHQTRKYRRSKLTKVSDLFSKDGRIGGKMIAEMESKGYRFSYNPETKKVIGLTPPGARYSLFGDAIGDHIDDYMEVKHPLRSSRWKTKRTNALYKRFGVTRRSVVAPSDTKVEDPEAELNKRIAEDTLGEPADLKEKPEDIPPDETKDQKAAREAREAAVADASKSTGDFEEMNDKIRKTGQQVEKLAVEQGIKEGVTAVEQLNQGAGGGVVAMAKRMANAKSFGSKLLGGIKSFFSPTDILDKVCTIKNRLTQSSVLARYHRAVAEWKNASVFVGVADFTRTGKPDPKLMKAIMKRVTSVDRNGNPIGASPGFIYAIKGKFSKSRNDSEKGTYAVDGQLTGSWKGFQDATNKIPGTTKRQCGVIQNPFFQLGTGIISTALCALSIGSSCEAEEGVNVTVTQAIKTAIEDTVRQIFTTKALKSLAISSLVGLGFDGIMAMTKLYIEKSLALPLTSQEQGAELGSLLIAGGGVGNKQRSLQAGMVPSTVQQYAQAETEFLASKKLETSQESFYARVLDTSNPDSLAFQFMASVPLGFESLLNSVRAQAADIGSWLLNGRFLSTIVDTVLGGRAHAEDEISYDSYTLQKGPYEGQKLAVDFAGNPQVILRSDVADIDPQENITYLSESGDINPNTLEIKSDRFKNHVANCVDNIDVISEIEFKEDATNPDHDCLAKNPLTVRFKAHLAYLDMLDGLQAEFDPGSI